MSSACFPFCLALNKVPHDTEITIFHNLGFIIYKLTPATNADKDARREPSVTLGIAN